MKLREAERLLHAAKCPFCLGIDFDFRLRCDLSQHEKCLSTAKCRRCGYEMDAEDLIKYLERRISCAEKVRQPNRRIVDKSGTRH